MSDVMCVIRNWLMICKISELKMSAIQNYGSCIISFLVRVYKTRMR